MNGRSLGVVVVRSLDAVRFHAIETVRGGLELCVIVGERVIRYEYSTGVLDLSVSDWMVDCADLAERRWREVCRMDVEDG